MSDNALNEMGVCLTFNLTHSLTTKQFMFSHLYVHHVMWPQGDWYSTAGVSNSNSQWAKSKQWSKVTGQ